MTKTSNQHVVYCPIEDEHGCTVYVLEWSGSRNRFSNQEIAQIAQKKHRQRRAQSYGNSQEEVYVKIGENSAWTTIRNVLWWIGAYTIAVIKFLFKLGWKMVFFFFVLFIGQLLFGIFLTR
jgi:hypothetical protein